MSRAARLTKTNIILGVAAVMLVAVAGILWFADKPNNQPGPTKKETTGKVASVRTEQETDYIKYQGETGKTALELLEAKADVKTEASQYGEFVKSINGEGGAGEKYWTFYINGQEASVGAGAYVTKNSEAIEWRLK